MNCTACGHVNPAESSFCLECGRPLVPGCAQCGTQLPPNAKFCNKCGASLPSHPAKVGERRELTVLFCDLVATRRLAVRSQSQDG